MARVAMVLSNSFTRDPRVYSECRTLTTAGHDVHVFAWDRHGDHEPEDEVAGAKVHRIVLDGPPQKLPLDILRLPGWWRQAARRLRREHEKTPFDLIHAHDLDTLPGAVQAAKVCRPRPSILYDSHEDWPAMIAQDLPRPVASWFARKERALAPHVDACLVASAPVGAALTARGMPSPQVLANAKHPVSRYTAPPDGLSAVYVGTIARQRFVHGIVQAAARVPGIRVRIAGPGKPRYVRRVQTLAEGAKNVTYTGPVPADQVLPLTLQHHVVLCPFDPDNRLTQIGMPNKFFEALATGRPILTSEGTHLAQEVERTRTGITVPHGIQGYAEGLQWYQDNPEEARRQGKRGLRLARSTHGWPAQGRILLSVYDRLLAPAG